MTAQGAAGGQPDPLDIAVLYREHHAEVFRYILRRCGGQVELAQDLAHDTWFKFARWAQTHTWVERGRPVLSMLYITASSIMCDFWKSGRSRTVPAGDLGATVLDEADDCDPQQEAVASVYRGRWRSVLEQAIAQLPLPQREVLHLTYVEGLSQREIADLLGTTAGAVKATTYRAMKALRADPRVQELDGEVQ